MSEANLCDNKTTATATAKLNYTNQHQHHHQQQQQQKQQQSSHYNNSKIKHNINNSQHHNNNNNNYNNIKSNSNNNINIITDSSNSINIKTCSGVGVGGGVGVSVGSVGSNGSGSTGGSSNNLRSKSSESFLQYGNTDDKPPPIVVVVGDGRSRVRRVVRTATRHVTVVSYSTRHKETRTHTSHHVTTVSFPQKSVEKTSSSQYANAVQLGGGGGSGNSTPGTAALPKDGGITVGGGSGGGATASVYLQQPHYISSTGTTGQYSTTAINYPIGVPPHIIYQHPAQQQQYQTTCHQSQQQIYQPTNIVNVSTGSVGSSSSSGMYADNMHHPHFHHHHHLLHGHHHHHHGGAVVIAGSGVGIGLGGVAGIASPPNNMQQNLHKKNSIRNNSDILKRSRAQTAYELSQDLLDKQIELLERKYGGLRARIAAITIQRAFRHFMMVKKFASITAMAKAEKRLSRRVLNSNTTTATGASGGGDEATLVPSNASLSSAYGSATESQLDMSQSQQQLQQQQQQLQQQQQQQMQHQPRVTIMAGPPPGSGAAASAAASPNTITVAAASARTTPMRSLSMRERRQAEGGSLPRSQSGASATSTSSISSNLGTAAHPHVNLLHATEPQYYAAHGGAMGMANAQLYCPTYHLVSHDGSFTSSASNSSMLDSSLNVSWAGGASGSSPHMPYYSAAQIYMRPKGTLTPTDRKKVPPEVPKRTSSITAQQHAAAQQSMLMMRQTPPPSQQQQPPPSGSSAQALLRSNGLCKTAENGSLTSVQSSGSESSITSAERIAAAHSDLGSDRSNSPNTWKRGTTLNSSQQFGHMAAHVAATSAGSIVSDDHAVSSHTSAAQYEQHEQQQQEQLNQLSLAQPAQISKVSETMRKRQYRVGLNLFNKKPEKGITYLIRRGFLENTPQGVARFLITRKGLSRQMIGEYLGNLQNAFNMAVLNCFALELDLAGMQVDVALRKFQTYFRMPGEAQKIERLMEIFSHRYCQCNPDIVSRLRSSDTIFVLAFAIIMLNTDLHTPNLKPERRMRVEDFVKNLRGIDDCHDIEKDMLVGIYERVKANEFKPGSDHVTQVMKVQATIVGKKPNLALPHRRLVCYCRLYEIPDINKKERPGVHQREVFLFNDLLVITKIFSKKKSSVTYTFRNSYPLCGMVVSLLDVANYQFCIQLSQKVDGKTLITFNARNEHDRCKFAEDLKESISEMDEMEALRIEAELERQKSARNRNATTSAENRDSGVADVEVCPCPYQNDRAAATGDATAAAQQHHSHHNHSHSHNHNHHNSGSADSPSSSQQLKRSALSNSLLDMHEQFGNEKPQRRGSVGSLDSGMSISFQSTTTSSASRDNATVIAAAAANAAAAAAVASKIRYAMPTTAMAAAVGGGGSGSGGMATVYTAAGSGMAGYAQANYMHPHSHHQHAALIMQQQINHQHQQHQQQQQPQTQQYTAAVAAAAHVNVQQQQQQSQIQQPQLIGRIPGRERKSSRSEENGRSTEV